MSSFICQHGVSLVGSMNCEICAPNGKIAAPPAPSEQQRPKCEIEPCVLAKGHEGKHSTYDAATMSERVDIQRETDYGRSSMTRLTKEEQEVNNLKASRPAPSEQQDRLEEYKLRNPILDYGVDGYAKQLAADDRLWTTQGQVERNLKAFAFSVTEARLEKARALADEFNRRSRLPEESCGDWQEAESLLRAALRGDDKP